MAEVAIKRKVLVVDDDPQIRKILTRMLEPSIYEIRSVDDGFTAIQSVREWEPDLVILDIMMPGMSGIEVCRQIRAEQAGANLQILMLSAKDSQADRLRALEYGANDYVTKPFHIASLGRKIQYMFEKQ